MQKYTNKQYKEIFTKLPPEIKEVIFSEDTIDHIWKIGGKHNLHIDLIGIMQDTALDVMMGIVATKDFVKELQNNLQIGALEASVLARDIDENIFRPIKQTMEHLYAGRAPFKPSSSLVQFYEEDDEHPSLDKNTLLKEIEDPTPSEVKKETVVTVGKGASVQAGKENAGNKELLAVREEAVSLNTNTEKPHTEIAEYHEELSNTPTPKPTKTPNIVQDSKKIGLPPIKIIKPESLEPATNPNVDKIKGDSILNQLAAIKLSKAFVMPKGPEGIQELRSLQDANTKLSSLEALGTKEKNVAPRPTDTHPILETPTTKVETKNDLPKSTNIQSVIEVVKSPETKVDPYREKI